MHEIGSVIVRAMAYSLEEMQLRRGIGAGKSLEVLPHGTVDGGERIFVAPEHENGVSDGRHQRVWLRPWRTGDDGNEGVQRSFGVGRGSDHLRGITIPANRR